MIIASNLKTNHTRKSTFEFLERVDKVKTEHKLVVFPPSTALCDHPFIGAQNACATQNGAFTGEIGLDQLEEFQIDKILIGHSERREILHESQETIAKKFSFFKEKGFEIYYCIGETLDVREKGIDAVFDHLHSQCEGVDLTYEKLYLAYEPVWAIGTGKSASILQIKEVHDKLREWTKRPLLYGGSVKEENIKEITALENVDGVLIGSASWDVSRFVSLIERCEKR